MLNIGNLKAIVEKAETWVGVSDETEVRVAMQPSWPFEYSLDPTAYGVTVIGSNQERPEREDFASDAEYLAAFLTWIDEADGELILYLAEGLQIGYLPTEARERLGW